MAFTVGMAYSPAETRPNNPHTCEVVLGHALLSYLFGPAWLLWQSAW
jgi:uncharacterized membrane protein